MSPENVISSFSCCSPVGCVGASLHPHVGCKNTPLKGSSQGDKRAFHHGTDPIALLAAEYGRKAMPGLSLSQINRASAAASILTYLQGKFNCAVL